ncbi:hypothetical protein BJY00DRAFT_285793 [Aspergillus carlsbadensis]|nr:hypothetical protein BJY00DRAFT_285793 [Aspergillus carlsbadensis]
MPVMTLLGGRYRASFNAGAGVEYFLAVLVEWWYVVIETERTSGTPVYSVTDPPGSLRSRESCTLRCKS